MIPDGAEMRILLTQPFVMGQRKEHPRGTGPLDLATCLGLRHVVASPLRGPLHGYMGDCLDQLGYQRNIALSVRQFGMVSAVRDKSDSVSTLPTGQLAGFADRLNMFALPSDAPPFARAMPQS